MALLAALGGGAFILVSLIVGGRLVLLSRQTRHLPEFAMGLGLFLMGGVGYPVVAIAQFGTGLPESVRSVLVATNMLCGVFGHGLLAVFTWRVFRPRIDWAKGLVAGIVLGLVAGFGYQGLVLGYASVAHGAPIWPGFTLFGVANLLWAGAESLHYCAMMGRRQKLGLADPVLTDRFRLWSIGILSAAVVSITALSFELVGVNMTSSALGAAVVAPLGLLTGGTMWFAFLPPARYTRWVTVRAG